MIIRLGSAGEPCGAACQTARILSGLRTPAMSSLSTPVPNPPLFQRRPFSLRELFCLLTLACMLLTLFLSDSLTDEERWLVGPACGAALLGILLARLCGRGSWLAGLTVGTLGAAVAIGRQAIPRQAIYEHLIQRAPSRLPDFWTDLTIMAVSGVAVGFILALLACV